MAEKETVRFEVLESAEDMKEWMEGTTRLCLRGPDGKVKFRLDLHDMLRNLMHAKSGDHLDIISDPDNLSFIFKLTREKSDEDE